jgi:competence protein ComEC
VYTSPHFRRHARESKPCRDLLAALDRSGHSPRLLVEGSGLSVGSGVQVEVLWPPERGTFNSNNAGLVLRLTYAGRSVLFPADIQEPAERELLKHPSRLRADVLIAPHHGSSEATTMEFVRAVAPKVIVCSNALRLTQKQKAFDREMSSYSEYRTSRSGAITIDIGGDGTLRVVPMHGTPWPLPR